MPKSLSPTLRFALRVAFPALVVLAGSVVTVLVSLHQMAGIVNRTESALIHRSAEAAVQSVLRRLGQSNADYAQWDDAVRHLYGEVDPDFMRESFFGASQAQTFFETVYVLDEAGSVLTAVRRGAATGVSLADAFGPSFGKLLQGIADDGRTYEVRTGFVAGVWGLVAVAVGPIVPAASDFPMAPTRSRYLVFAKSFDDTAADFLEREYLIDGFRVVPHRPDTPDHIDLKDPAGETLAAVTWNPASLGSQARARVGPAVYLMLAVIFTVFGGLLLYAMRGLARIRQGERLARHAADHDALTGLPNRVALLQRLEEMTERVRDENATAWLIFLDLDGFKEVNDAYGHAIGDRLLRNVAAGLRPVVADRLVSRVGGDEFAILSQLGEPAEAGSDIGRLLIRYFSQPFDIDGRTIFIGTSVGISTVDVGETAEEILRRADTAMYRAKAQGRNRIVAYEPTFDAERQERVAIAADLGKALRDGELELAYQAVVDAEDRCIVGAEALVRWMRDGKEVLPAGVFVPIAEETGLIDELGVWVLRQACRDARAWTGIHVAVNVSPAQLRNPNFEILVQRVLSETGLQPDRLELEVTETYLVSNPAQAGYSINAIRALGVRIALDDFGTGYSSIGYLRSFAFDKMKLDRSLLAGIASDQRAQRFLQATVALAESLGLGIVAEGVESESEATLLKIAGCREFQGYLFARPCPAIDLSRMLDAQSERGGRAALARV